MKIREDKKKITREESYKRMHSKRMITCEHAVIDELEKYDGSKIAELRM